jgi:hypothetical protein
MDNIIFRPGNYKTWSIKAIEKIEAVIDSCVTFDHLDSARKLVDQFSIITALEQDDEKSIEIIIHQLWLRIKLQENKINGSK